MPSAAVIWVAKEGLRRIPLRIPKHESVLIAQVVLKGANNSLLADRVIALIREN